MTLDKIPNRNAQRSRKLIQAAFLQLLLKKEPSKIKACEVIQLADISKGTFYAHYTCVYDVLLEIQKEQLELMFLVFEEHSPEFIIENFYPLFLCGLKEMEKKRELFRILFRPDSGNTFLDKLKETFLSYLLSAGTNSGYQKKTETIKSYLTYVAGGSIAIIQNWLEGSPDVPAETVARFLSDCALSGIRNLTNFSYP